MVIATEDGRTISLTLIPQTKFTRAGSDITASKIIPRTTVHIEANEDEEAFLTATTVELVKDAPPESPQDAMAGRRAGYPAADNPEDHVRPTILNNSVDAPDRPILRHGKPKNTVLG